MGVMVSSSAAAWMPHDQPLFGSWVASPSSSSSSEVGPTSLHLFATSIPHLRPKFILHLFFKKLSNLCNLPIVEDVWHGRFQFKDDFNFLQHSNGSFDFASSPMSFSMGFFNGGQSSRDSKSGFDKRRWTNVLLAVNVLVYLAQVSTKGKLLLWGAKVNSLIDKGQLWRLVTSSLLHANIGHLMINCYSLNSIGPSVEYISGPKRFVAIYFSSAVTSSLASYWFCKSPAVGASGAIFGLVGSFGVFIMRHRGLIKGGEDDLRHIAQVIFINMAIGLLSKGIDNWGHLGGLLGGCATSWFLGPAWKYESLSNGRRKIFVDRAPINYLINWNKGSKKLN
ncbi:RHOMBOID-like protein 10, chloroplastic [Rutidosis leptorrhynchoides]|uniref:RHOMBOID-like protein 10, chloroplastic n=1 Tax=Rutidosis leptorrhynchoides TaxID=125765 RepID=UPI003A9A3A7E